VLIIDSCTGGDTSEVESVILTRSAVVS